MEQCFIPGDVVKARVTSYGDSRKIQLSTAFPECGVVFAQAEVSKSLMFPLDWQKMVCPVTQIVESRKVAKP